MKSSISILAILLFVSSCKPSPETKYDKEGVSFISPLGWEISDEQNFYGLGHYLVVEKDAWGSSGMLTISWVNGESDLDSYLEDLKLELKDNIIYRRSNLDYGNHYEGTFNNLRTKAVDYTVSILSIDHIGVIHVFNRSGRTFFLMRQEATEDVATNKIGFDKIEKSFKVLEQI